MYINNKNTAEHLNENEIEVISKNTMGELALGKDDIVAKEKATDIDGNDTVEDIEIAIYSYNNAIDTINNYCNSLIKIDNLGVRSVGSKPSDPSNKNTNKPYAIQNLDKWEDKTAWETYGVLGEDADNNSDDDYNQLVSLGINRSENSKGYWLASRDAYEDTSSFSSVYFNVRAISAVGNGFSVQLWNVNYNGSNNSRNPENAVRPIIKLQYPQSSN